MFLSEWITQRGACTEAGVRVRLAVSGLFSASKGAAGHGELSDLLTPGHSQVFLQAALEFHQAVWRAHGEVRKPSINQGQLGDTLARLRTLMLFSVLFSRGRGDALWLPR